MPELRHVTTLKQACNCFVIFSFLNCRLNKIGTLDGIKKIKACFLVIDRVMNIMNIKIVDIGRKTLFDEAINKLFLRKIVHNIM